MKKSHFVVVGFFVFVTFLLFSPFFLKGQAPFPGNFLQAWYEPWRTSNWNNGQLIPHKPVADDVFRQLFPFKSLAMEQIKNGHWPLWNPFNGGGMPLLSTMHVGFLNPFNLFYFLFSDQVAWSLLVVVQPLLLAISFFVFARYFNLSLKAAILSSLAWVTSGFVVVRYIYADQLFSLSAFPLILVLVNQIIKKGKKRQALWLPWLIFFVLGSGHPQGAFYVLFFSFLFALIIVLQKRLSKESLINLLILILAVLAGFLLALPQLVLTADLWQKAALDSSSSQFIFQRFLLPFSSLITLIVPNFFGNLATYNFWGPADFIETVFYLGSGVFLLSLFGAFALKKIDSSLRWLLLAMAVFAFSISFKTPFSLFISSLNLPFFSTSIPTRSFAFLTLSLCFLAGLGFDYWQNSKDFFKKAFRFVLPLFLFLWLLAFLPAFFNHHQGVVCPSPDIPCWLVGARNSILAFLVLTLTLFLLYLGKFLKKKKTLLFYPLIVLLLTSNLYLAKKFLPFTRSKDFYPQVEVLSVLQKQQENELSRFWSVGEGKIKTDLATIMGLNSPDYYDPLYLKQFGELVSFANQGTTTDIKRSDVEIDDSLNQSTLEGRRKLLELLSVKFILLKKENFYDSQASLLKETFCDSVFWQDDNWLVCRTADYLPYFYLFTDYQVVNDSLDILPQLLSKDFDLKSSVFVEEKLPFEGISGKEATLKSVSKEPGDYLFEVETKTSGLFYLNENFDSGWQAVVDGKKASLLRSNFSFIGLPLEAGKHEVRLFYQPSYLQLTIYVSITTFVLLVVIILFVLRYNNGRNNGKN